MTHRAAAELAPMTPLRRKQPKGIPMNPSASDEPEAEPGDPVALHIAASELEVYRHERLAFTELPARRPKSKRRSAIRMRKLLTAIYHWVITHG